MKTFAILATVLAMAFSTFAEATNIYEKFSPPLPTNTPIIWAASMQALPKNFWIYHKVLPHVFPTAVISNALVLANYQNRDIPSPSTNETCIVDDPDCHCHCMTVCNFSIRPSEGSLAFYSPNQNSSTQAVPDASTITNLAWRYARQFQINPKQVVLKDVVMHFNSDTNDNVITNQISGCGVFLARDFDGVPFIGNGNDGFVSEGFYIEFGSYNTIRNFALIWPELEPYQSENIASPQQIIACIRARKLTVMPEGNNDTNYFGRIKALSNVKSFKITQITPYYIDGWLGTETNDQELPKFIAPIAELKAVADFGTSNTLVRLFSPLVPSEVNQLLK